MPHLNLWTYYRSVSHICTSLLSSEKQTQWLAKQKLTNHSSCSQDNHKTKNKDQDYGDDQEETKDVDNN